MSRRNRMRRRTREDFHSVWDGWRLLVKRRPSAWAAEERRIAAGQSPLTDGDDIRYSHAVMPHCVEPMDAADDPEVNVIVLWMGRRLGKTEGICANIIGRTVTDDPSNIYSMWPVEDSSDRFSRDVIEPMIEATPILRSAFVEKKSRESGRTIDYKRFAGGSLYIVNAGSKSKSRGMAAKVVLTHEVDAYPVSAGGEGDPIEKAFGRAEGFSAVKIIESTGTIAATLRPDGAKDYHSNIEKWYDRSDQRKWFCPCRKCGAAQWLKWEQIRELPKKSGELWFYLCETCDADHNEKQWRRMVAGGIWKPTAPFVNGIRGYWINGFNSLLPTGRGFKTKLHQFAAEGARAMKGTPEERRVWVNEVKNELVSPTENGEPPPAWKPIFDRREDYDVIPAGGLFLTAAVDCQLNRLEVLWRAWGREEESWGMDHVTIDGYVRDKEVWQMLSVELARKFKHASGAELRLSMCLVDGGAYQEDVYRFTQRLANSPVPGVTGNCRASKGIGQFGHPVVDSHWKTIAKNLKGYHIGTWEAKDRIYERLRIDPASENREGVMHYNRRFSEAFFQQLTVETVTIEYSRGQEIRKYVNPQQMRNEALDLEVGNLAAFRLRPKNFDTLQRMIDEQAAIAKGEKSAPVEEQPKAVRRLSPKFRYSGRW